MKQTEPNFLDTLQEQAYIAFFVDDFAKAKDCFQVLALSESSRHRANAYFTLATIAFREVDYDGAQKSFTKAVINALENKDFDLIVTSTTTLENRFFQVRQFDQAKKTLSTGLNALLQKYTPANETGSKKKASDILAVVSNPAVSMQEKETMIRFLTMLSTIYIAQGRPDLAHDILTVEANLWERAGNQKMADQAKSRVLQTQTMHVLAEQTPPPISPEEMLGNWSESTSPSSEMQDIEPLPPEVIVIDDEKPEVIIIEDDTQTASGQETPTAGSLGKLGEEAYYQVGHTTEAVSAAFTSAAVLQYNQETINTTPTVVALTIQQLQQNDTNALKHLEEHLFTLDLLNGALPQEQQEVLNAMVAYAFPYVQNFARLLPPEDNAWNKRFFQQFGLTYEAPAQFAVREEQRRNTAAPSHDTPDQHRDKRRRTEENPGTAPTTGAVPQNLVGRGFYF